MKRAVWVGAYAVLFTVTGLVGVESATPQSGSGSGQLDSWGTRPIGDFDEDGWVCEEDYAAFVDCMSGADALPVPTPPVTVEQCLTVFDSDGDMDVDLIDFGAFQAHCLALAPSFDEEALRLDVQGGKPLTWGG